MSREVSASAQSCSDDAHDRRGTLHRTQVRRTFMINGEQLANFELPPFAG